MKFIKKDLFDYMLKCINIKSKKEFIREYEAFPKWFSSLYYLKIDDIFISDGNKDGKIDFFFTTHDNEKVKHHIVNSKFTKDYDRTAPTNFYDEIISFYEIFENKNYRSKYLNDYIRKELRTRYYNLLEQFDKGNAELIFVTNYKRNDNQFERVRDYNVNIFHLEDILQYMIDDLEGAMPRTNNLLLSNITTLLSPSKEESKVPTSIVFARLIDFLKYMVNDPYDLLFARNIRLWLGYTEPNTDIKNTFDRTPNEFAFSNNGVTLICENYIHDPGNQELTIINPRVVNGSQTLHSIRDVKNPSSAARVMLRIIKVEAISSNDLTEKAQKRKEIIGKISIRSNLQNPITKWNLVANDDYQQALKRNFRHKGFFYETRKNEWNWRKSELKSVNIKRGPFITKLTQLISSFYYNEKRLGPAIAKGNLKKLFDEDKTYTKITETNTNDAYKIFLLNDKINQSTKIASNTAYVENTKRHINYVLFSVYIKIIKDNLGIWNDNKFEYYLEKEFENGKLRKWGALTKEIVRFILDYYEKENTKYKRKMKKELTLNNYFKGHSYIQKILNQKLPDNIIKLSKNVF